jgi:thiol-disulfide isomerase/thioredoxin
MYKSYRDLGEKSETQLDKLLVIEDLKQKKNLIKTNRLVAVLCSASWCNPCKVFAPKFYSLSLKYPDVVFAKEDVELELSQLITAVPTVQFFFEGTYIDQITGPDIGMVEDKIKKFGFIDIKV